PDYQKRIAGNNHGPNLLLSERRERRLDLSLGARIHNHEFEIKSTSNVLHIGSLLVSEVSEVSGQKPNGRNVGNNIVQKREALAGYITAKPSHAGNVLFRSV